MNNEDTNNDHTKNDNTKNDDRKNETLQSDLLGHKDLWRHVFYCYFYFFIMWAIAVSGVRE